MFTCLYLITLISCAVGVITVDNENTPALLPCKELCLEKSGLSPPILIQNDTLNHAALQRDSAGRLAHFEAHLGIEADGDVRIWLTDSKSFFYSDVRYYIDIATDGNRTELYRFIQDYTRIQEISTPNLISATEFRAFYLTIDDDTLQFGKEGNSAPLISHNDERFGLVKYFHFLAWYNGTKIRYDCPAPTEH